MTEAAAFGGVAFSSSVKLWLEFGESRIPLSHVEPDRIVARCPHDLPPGDGVVVVSINDQTFRTPVTLTYGMRADDPETPISTDDSIPF